MYLPTKTFHPVLETLEDRTAFAVDVVTSPVALPVSPTPTALQGSVLREIDPQSTVTQTLGATNAPLAVALTASTPTIPPTLPTTQAPSSYPGRLALAGTGVQQRVAFGDGPFTQQPGLYLVGGGNEEIFPPQRPAPQPVPLSAPGETPTFSVSHEQADVRDVDAAWLLPPAPDATR
jgi:hypothetical protein